VDWYYTITAIAGDDLKYFVSTKGVVEQQGRVVEAGFR
jgi:hypothetical protein